MLAHANAIKVFVVLGCNIGWLQQDRISAALEYWSSIDNSEESIWYLSGGVKNAIVSTVSSSISSEAEQMKQELKSANLNIVLDTTATNTAENFRNFSKFVENLNPLSNLEIIIVTSKFHKTRAEKFFYGFFPQTLTPHWVLASGECPTCAQDELYHMRNVELDITKALGY